MKSKCDECEKVFDVLDIFYYQGFYLCRKCEMEWMNKEPSPDEYDENEESWDQKPKKRVRLKDNYKPNPDFELEKLEGECPNCND